MISTLSDPASGSLAKSVAKKLDYWTRAKYIAEMAFFIWTSLCNSTLTILVGHAVLFGVVKQLVASSRAEVSNHGCFQSLRIHYIDLKTSKRARAHQVIDSGVP
ncbi:unnamed protein product [Caenorhabditis brenneri]